MSVRAGLKWLNDALRPVRVAGHAEGAADLTSDKDDALTSAGAHFSNSDIGMSAHAAPTAPTKWVPSQQDERPRH